MRVKIASRIFEPEPAAASFRLGALATALSEKRHDVKVLTVRPPKSISDQSDDSRRPYEVSRFPVLRDRAGYVRGYLQYLSFDIPLFFRVLLGNRVTAIVVEPPPTTGFFVRIAAAMRQIPYFYYAADIWSDGAAQTGAPKWILRAVLKIEKFAMHGARKVFSVSESLTQRLNEVGITADVLTVGNGVNANAFFNEGENFVKVGQRSSKDFIYAGIASEWHGAGVFVEALPHVLEHDPDVLVRFIGGGSEVEKFHERAVELGVDASVRFEEYVSPRELAGIFSGSAAALASVREGLGNEFVFPTKLYSAVLCGVPSIFAGIGPAIDFLANEVEGLPIGVSVPLDPIAVAGAMLTQLKTQEKPGHRELVSTWGMHNVTLSVVADRIVAEIEKVGAS